MATANKGGKNGSADGGYRASLWQVADAPCGSMDAILWAPQEMLWANLKSQFYLALVDVSTKGDSPGAVDDRPEDPGELCVEDAERLHRLARDG